MKFRGSLVDLKLMLKDYDIVGTWEQEPNGVYMMRGADGANLHWASGTGALWSDGKATACAALLADLAHILDARAFP